MTQPGPYRAGPPQPIAYGPDRCSSCGATIPLISRIMGRSVCVACETRANQARGAFLQYAHQCLADGILTPDEESALLAYQAQLGIADAQISDIIPALLRAKAFYGLSQGSLPVVPDAPLFLAAGEQCHAACWARLLEERTYRVTVGRSAGVSLRVSKHIRIRQGASRGVSMPVTEMVPLGDGTLCVTSERVVFLGPRTVEIKIGKLLGVEAYRDGVEPQHAAARKRQIFGVQDGEWMANVMLVAAQLWTQRPDPPKRQRRR